MPSFAVILYGKLLYFEQYQRLLILALREPNALQVEKQGLGYVVASIGELGGVVPYTAYNARKSYIEENPDIIEGFTKGIQRGIDYVYTHTDAEIAEILLEYFPDTSLNDLTEIVKRYRNIDSWFETTFIEEENFDHIQTIMESAGELDKKAPYSKLVDNSYSEK